MARRKTKRKTRRRKTGVSIIGLAETYLLTNVATQTFFNANPVTFLVGNTSSGVAAGSAAISVKEIASSFGSGSNVINRQIMKNMNSNWMKGIAGMVLIPIGFRVGKALARPAISKANRLLGKVGVSKTVKV